MKSWLLSPLMSLALLILWLMLNQSLDPGHILLGMGLVIVLQMMASPLRPFTAHVKKPLVIVRLTIFALIEIVRSCFNVSRIILFAKQDQLNSQFIKVPLDLRDPYGLAVLSCMINSTPGTVWVEILPNSNDLALHVFDLHDAQWWIDTIKTRYEKPLIEIFE